MTEHFGSDEGGALTHRAQLFPRDIGGEMAQTAVRIDHQSIWRQDLQRLVHP